jgi:hypothetical protein
LKNGRITQAILKPIRFLFAAAVSLPLQIR